jgi:Tfp pilus assembly protein FimT
LPKPAWAGGASVLFSIKALPEEPTAVARSFALQSPLQQTMINEPGTSVAYPDGLSFQPSIEVSETMTRQSERGLTLIELATVCAMLAILVGFAFPMFNTTIAQHRLSGATQRVANDLRYARSTAVTQGTIQRLHSGDDGGVQPGQYRLEQSPTGSAPWTSLTPWYSLATDYQGAAMASIKDGTSATIYEVSFNAQGAPNAALNYPLNITVTTPVGTRSIQVMRTGNIVVP